MANRKLQVEIDRTLKKIAEGIEAFDDIWEMVYSASNVNQKEKYEADLKKEIKKLQRFRDSLKTWINSSEIKDKSNLIEARKNIEKEMERFKICEKEAKTKAYSKEGLINAAKADRDPREKAKNETRAWVKKGLSELQNQIDQFEAQIETLSSKKKGRDNQRISQLEEGVTNHQFHIDKLEVVMRRLDNDEVTAEQIDSLREDIEYYVESNEDDECFFDDGLYDELLPGGAYDQTPVVAAKAEPTPEPAAASKPAPTPVVASYEEPVISSNSRLPPKKKEEKAAEGKGKGSGATTTTKDSKKDKKEKAAAAATAQQQAKATGPNAQAQAGRGGAQAAQNAQQPQQQGKAGANAKQQPQQQAQQQGQQQAQQQGQQQGGRQSNNNNNNNAGNAANANATSQNQANVSGAAQQQQQPQQQATAAANATGGNASQAQQPPAQQPPAAAQHVSPHTSPGGPQGIDVAAAVALSPDVLPERQRHMQLQMLKSSFVHIPEPREADGRVPAPKTPFRTPASYPRVPHAATKTPSVYEKLDLDTLFFIFYYQQGTYPQYLAAKELKRQSWRFHKKFLTWFKRHDEPTVTTEDYEQGTYVYFDYESGWCQRIKRDFTFEYAYLEDTLQL